MKINKVFLQYITNEVMVNFIKEQRIKVKNGKFSSLFLIEAIENYANESDQNKEKLNDKIDEWIFQGRKKVLYRYFKDEPDIELFDENGVIQYINQNFLIEEINKFEELEYVGDKRIYNIEYAFTASLEYLKFSCLLRANQKNKDDSLNEIFIPAFIEVDFANDEIIGRIASKSDLMTINGEKTEDVKLLEDLIEDILVKLQIDVNISSVQKIALEHAIYEVHSEITDLPEEIVNKLDLIKIEMNDFINISIENLELSDDENTREEIQRGIENTLLKIIISRYDNKNIFKEGKYAISTGFNLSSKSKSMVNYQAPAYEPVQSNPDYQNIRNIMLDSNKIKKDSIFWNSNVLPGYKIRMKIYTHNKGYIQVCFEQYVYEEDIQNVLSKIREFV